MPAYDSCYVTTQVMTSKGKHGLIVDNQSLGPGCNDPQSRDGPIRLDPAASWCPVNGHYMPIISQQLREVCLLLWLEFDEQIRKCEAPSGCSGRTDGAECGFMAEKRWGCW